MQKKLTINTEKYEIPAIFTCPDDETMVPAMILCHGTGSDKNEVGNMFVKQSEYLAVQGIASIRFDFAGCGESKAAQQELTFFGEVEDTVKVYEYLKMQEVIDTQRIGILGFSQGARVMAETLKKLPEMKCAVSWSGCCHAGMGVFEGWFTEYYEKACQNGYARLPMDWRDDLLISKEWFDEIRESSPIKAFEIYKGPVLAIAGTKDTIVDYHHSEEIVRKCKNKESECVVFEGADHTFCVLTEDKTISENVIQKTGEWIKNNI